MAYDPARKALEIELAWAQRERSIASVKRRQRLRERVSAEQNHRCCYCGARTNEARTALEEPTLEHIVPRSAGGADSYENCVMACWSCNQDRGHGFFADHFRLAEVFDG